MIPNIVAFMTFFHTRLLHCGLIHNGNLTPQDAKEGNTTMKEACLFHKWVKYTFSSCGISWFVLVWPKYVPLIGLKHVLAECWWYNFTNSKFSCLPEYLFVNSSVTQLDVLCKDDSESVFPAHRRLKVIFTWFLAHICVKKKKKLHHIFLRASRYF